MSRCSSLEARSPWCPVAWGWPERHLSGNAIDLFMRVLGFSFHQAMRQITGA